jgi:hypothetical protein
VIYEEPQLEAAIVIVGTCDITNSVKPVPEGFRVWQNNRKLVAVKGSPTLYNLAQSTKEDAQELFAAMNGQPSPWEEVEPWAINIKRETHYPRKLEVAPRPLSLKEVIEVIHDNNVNYEELLKFLIASVGTDTARDVIEQVEADAEEYDEMEKEAISHLW